MQRQLQRYGLLREISAHLDQVKLPFTVDFQYLESASASAAIGFPL